MIYCIMYMYCITANDKYSENTDTENFYILQYVFVNDYQMCTEWSLVLVLCFVYELSEAHL